MKRELRNSAGDEQYLEAVRSALQEAFARFQPHLVIYNAGTDILQGEAVQLQAGDMEAHWGRQLLTHDSGPCLLP